MKSVLEKRLLRRELGEYTPFSSIAGIYGDKTWIEDMDIVNELGGHTGCVNALRYCIPFFSPASFLTPSASCISGSWGVSG